MRENCDSVVVAMDGGEFAKVMDAETVSQMAQGECAYEGSFNEMVADALVAAFDEEEPPEDFWAKHDNARHHGHFDPTTMTCKLREAYAKGEAIENLRDEMDDLGGASPGGGGVELKPRKKPRKMGISRIFTGSGADYSKPSLLHVGEGEGRQVYGWGLYGTNVKGVAKSYASQGPDAFETEVKYQGNPITEEFPKEIKEIAAILAYAADHPEWYSSPEDVFNRNITKYESNTGLKDIGLQYKKWAEEEKRLLEIYQENRDKWEVKKARNVLYEQTFFTDRAPGDESHLLKWYEPVSEEQIGWIEKQLEAEGYAKEEKAGFVFWTRPESKNSFSGNSVFSYKKGIVDDAHDGEWLYERLSKGLRNASPQAASEFLARAGIDGVKYPVDSYGKQVKDGDKVGWNYVSFRDDNIRIDRKYVDGQKVFDYQELMAKRLPGVDAVSVLNRISKMGSKEAMAAEFRRILSSGKVTEDSLNEVMALAVEAAFGIGQDALDPLDPDFWMKHDRAKHGGHFDPDTMSCELREQMGLPTVKNRGERDAAKAREDAKVDDLGGETPQDNIGTGVDAKKAALANAIGKTAPKMVAEQMVDAVEWMARKPTAKQDIANSARAIKNKARRTQKVSAQDFHKAISEAKEARSAADRWRVDVHPVEDYEQDECYMSEGGSTFAIADGDIISVCKNPTDTQCSGVDLMREAVEAGGKKLDSYEGNHRFYVKCGFKPVAWTKFNPEYAEPGTPPEDVIFYIYTGEARKMSPEDAVADIEMFKGETQAMEYMDAGSYRDSLLGQ